MSEQVIQSLYRLQLKQESNLELIDQQICNWLQKKTIDTRELVDHFVAKEMLSSTEKSITQWKLLLKINFLHFFSDQKLRDLAHFVRQFERIPWNQSSQCCRLYVAFNHFLVQLPIPEVAVNLLSGGAALIEFKEYAPWLVIPYHPDHLEFGILLGLFSLLLDRLDLKKKFIEIAHWQKNLLDAKANPFFSLYSQEEKHCSFQMMLLYTLFFKCAAFLTKEEDFIALYQHFSSRLSQLTRKSEKIDPLWVIVESFFEFDSSQKSNFKLDAKIYDPSTALIGYRTANQSAICTLHGYHTGVGCLNHFDVEIVNYGPQYLPLHDCKGFGIEGNHLSDQGIRQPFLQTHSSGFSIKGCVRMVDQPAQKSNEPELFRGIWIELSQRYELGKMEIDATFLSLDSRDNVAFCFFVKAQSCLINGEITLLPNQLNHYRGSVAQTEVKGEEGSLKIDLDTSQGSLHLLPLEGKHRYWGASFLIAYLLKPETKQCRWQIAPA